MQVQRLFPQCTQCLRRLSQKRRVSMQLPGTLLLRLSSTEAGSGSATAAASSPPIPPPPVDGKSSNYPDKIKQIVDDISQLTLLETSQLNDLLKVTLKIPDAPAVMTMGAMSTPASQEESAPEEAADTQSSFTVKLVKYVEDSKIKLIKEVKAQTAGMNLVQAKKFVESLPKEVKGGINKEEAEKVAAALKAAGGVVEIV